MVFGVADFIFDDYLVVEIQLRSVSQLLSCPAVELPSC